MEDVSKREGLGFFSVLTIVFVVLKLTDQIDWSWWWVLSPLWLPITTFIVIALLLYVLMKSID